MRANAFLKNVVSSPGPGSLENDVFLRGGRGADGVAGINRHADGPRLAIRKPFEKLRVVLLQNVRRQRLHRPDLLPGLSIGADLATRKLP